MKSKHLGLTAGAIVLAISAVPALAAVMEYTRTVASSATVSGASTYSFVAPGAHAFHVINSAGSAVPETEPYAAMLASLALMGALVHRRKAKRL